MSSFHRMFIFLLRKASGGIAALLLLTPTFFLILPSMALADVSLRQQGANITPTSPDSFGSSEMYQSLKDLKAAHANAVSLVMRFEQSSVNSTDIFSTNNTPTDAALVKAIQEAHSLGLAVTLKPHLDPQDGQWRAFIDPSDRATWFANYSKLILKYAQIAKDNNVEQYVIGTELIDMASAAHNPTNTQNWNTLIASVRALYTGKLGYAANWGPTGTALDEKNQIAFWDKLDFAGVDAYYNLGSAKDGSVESLQAAWDVWNKNDITVFAQKVKIPLIFTEVGYKSIDNSHTDPGVWQTNGAPNMTEQANDYQAFFSYWNSIDFLKGIFLWEWQPSSSAGGAKDTDYTPQNKPAQAIVAAWYGGTGVVTPFTQAQSSATTHSFTATTGANTIPASVNTAVSITSSITNNGNGSENGMIVDTEVYDSTGKQVFQHFIEGENFSQGQTKQYKDQWTPSVPGTYKVSVGVFTGNWAENRVWNNVGGTITVGTQSSGPAQVQSVSASATSTTGVLSKATPIEVTVKTNNQSLENALVDVEMYDSNGAKVFQDFTPNLTLASSDVQTYGFMFTPKTPGAYRVAVGVFNKDWSKNYAWNGNAGTLTIPTITIESLDTPTNVATTSSKAIATTTAAIATSTPATLPALASATTTPSVASSTIGVPSVIIPVTTPVITPVATATQTTPATPVASPTAQSTPATADINVWWPTTASTISGVTPFKAVVDGMPLSSYTMSWQVDNGQLNTMADNTQDAPHKESTVDVGGWNWQSSGSYALNFVAKSLAGAVIATKNVIVTIVH